MCPRATARLLTGRRRARSKVGAGGITQQKGLVPRVKGAVETSVRVDCWTVGIILTPSGTSRAYWERDRHMFGRMHRRKPPWDNGGTSRLYWRLVLGCVLGSAFYGTCCVPRMNPTSFWAEGVYKLLFIVPLAVAWGAGVFAGASISFRARCWSGFIQSLIVVCLVFGEFLFRSRRSVLGISGEDPPEILAGFLAAIVAIYTASYASATHLMGKWLVGRTPDDLTCGRCGYCLRGLRDPRCPECGTPFDPKLLQNRLPESGDKSGNASQEVEEERGGSS
jgi:hypothetical protein